MRKTERKGTQYTVLHTVKARADKGLRERATFYRRKMILVWMEIKHVDISGSKEYNYKYEIN